MEKRDLVLIAPTWRVWLNAHKAWNESRRQLSFGWRESDFVKQWMSLLTAPELAEAAERKGLQIGFLPHPNLFGLVASLQLPHYVNMFNMETEDVQQLFARAAVFVTDYSSMAFNAGFLGRPCVYFQFDQERFLEGDHLCRPGYFDYQRDGFGPVATTATEALEAIVASVEYGTNPATIYRERMDATFVLRDTGACKRIVTEIEQL